MRKKFLIKPALQIRFLFWTLIVVFAGIGFGYLFMEHRIASAVSSNGELTSAQWIIMKQSFRWVFLYASVLLLLIIGMEHYFFFHRVVGPIYALEKGLKRLAQGDFLDVTQIRDSDYFGEVIRAFEDMKRNLQSRIDIQQQKTQLLNRELDRILSNPSAENIRSLRQRLKAIQDEGEKKAA